MKNKKTFLSLLLVLSLVVSSLLVSTVNAATTGTVTATVTARNISVTIDNASVAFGTIATSATSDTTSSGVDDSVTATNNGNLTEKLNIMAGNSTNWTLGGTAGSETYTMKFCTSNCDTTPSWASVGIDPAYATLAANVAKDGTQVFDLQVGTPTTTANYGEQSITVTIQATTP